MTWNGQAVLAVVPARGGSKSIPRKNLSVIGGMSLVARVGALCRDLDWIDHAVVSTDDEDIAAEARAHGLEAPFLRPDELATDQAASIDAWRHALLACEDYYGVHYGVSLLLEPTSPLRHPLDVERTVAAVVLDGYPAAATVSPMPAHFTPHKALIMEDGDSLGFYHEQGAEFAIRQRIPQFYHRNGVCYSMTREALLEPKNRNIIDHDCRGIVIDRPLVNIDDPFELEIAEWLLARDRDSGA